MMSFEFLDGRAGKHVFVNAEKIWFDDAPNEWIINKKVVFFG